MVVVSDPSLASLLKIWLLFLGLKLPRCGAASSREKDTMTHLGSFPPSHSMN